jgi:hypothetical protein
MAPVMLIRRWIGCRKRLNGIITEGNLHPDVCGAKMITISATQFQNHLFSRLSREFIHFSYFILENCPIDSKG